jgi:hypothetical protein
MTEQEEDAKAAKLQKWQRDKFARELGFAPGTTNPLEIADIDMKYEEMLHGLILWDRFEQQRKDKIAIAELKLEHNLISVEEYDRITDGYD